METHKGCGFGAHIFLALSAHKRVTCSASRLASFPSPAPEKSQVPIWVGHLKPDLSPPPPPNLHFTWEINTLTTSLLKYFAGQYCNFHFFLGHEILSQDFVIWYSQIWTYIFPLTRLSTITMLVLYCIIISYNILALIWVFSLHSAIFFVLFSPAERHKEWAGNC